MANDTNGISEPGLGNGGEDILLNVGLAIATFGASIPEQLGLRATTEAAESFIPKMLARVIPGEGPFPTLAPPGAADAFVTTPEAIAGMTPEEIANTLTIAPADKFTVIEFPTPEEGLAQPVFRDNPGFVGGGKYRDTIPIAVLAAVLESGCIGYRPTVTCQFAVSSPRAHRTG